MTAVAAAVAAIIMLQLRTDLAITIAGVLSALAGGTALAGSWLRSRRPLAADAASVVVGALVFATVLSVVLGVVMAGRPER